MGPVDEKRSVLRSLWRDKIHIEPRALELSPRAVQERFEHVWQPTDLLLKELELFPLGLLRLWHGLPRGHVVVTHRPSAYRSGPHVWRDGLLESVSFLSITDLARDKRSAMLAVLACLDHLMGSGCAQGESWFSDGSGVSDAMTELAQRFQRIYRLGYGREELGASDAHSYLSETLWLYLSEPVRLNVLDPLIHRLYHGALMSEEAWARL